MSKDNEDKPKREYEVGYGKPPKHTQFKSKSAMSDSASSGKRGRKSKAGVPEPIDISRLLSERITVTRGGASTTMEGYEVAVRAQLKKAVKDKNLVALNQILKLAREFDLVKPPPEQAQLSPVIQIRKDCPDADFKKIANPEISQEERSSVVQQWGRFALIGGDHG